MGRYLLVAQQTADSAELRSRTAIEVARMRARRARSLRYAVSARVTAVRMLVG